MGKYLEGFGTGFTLRHLKQHKRAIILDTLHANRHAQTHTSPKYTHCLLRQLMQKTSIITKRPTLNITNSGFWAKSQSETERWHFNVQAFPQTPTRAYKDATPQVASLAYAWWTPWTRLYNYILPAAPGSFWDPRGSIYFPVKMRTVQMQSVFLVTLILWCWCHICLSHPGYCRTPVAPVALMLVTGLDSHPNLAVSL